MDSESCHSCHLYPFVRVSSHQKVFGLHWACLRLFPSPTRPLALAWSVFLLMFQEVGVAYVTLEWCRRNGQPSGVECTLVVPLDNHASQDFAASSLGKHEQTIQAESFPVLRTTDAA